MKRPSTKKKKKKASKQKPVKLQRAASFKTIEPSSFMLNTPSTKEETKTPVYEQDSMAPMVEYNIMIREEYAIGDYFNAETE